MEQQIIIFDMDGVLLSPGGYHQALRASVRRVGLALGVPGTDLTADQNAQFEALNITNEWDSLAICAALTLVHVWQADPKIRLDGSGPRAETIVDQPPDFDIFLRLLPDGGDLPGETVLEFLLSHHPWLDSAQRSHLSEVLINCRDIYQSLTLPAHQETVLGSENYHRHYNLEPRLNTISYLQQFDRPLLRQAQYTALRQWHQIPNHHAGIMTNRPSRTPPDYISAPEAELGLQLIALSDLPYIGSGILGWFATQHCQLPAHTFLKPNPVHALALIQACLGHPLRDALEMAASLWRGESPREDWSMLHGAKMAVFEDSAKGLRSVNDACLLLADLGVHITPTLVGVTDNPVKREPLEDLADNVIEDINQVHWFENFS